MPHTYDFEQLQSKYNNFENPAASVKINGLDISDNKINLIVSDMEVELTSDMEASVAVFKYYNVYDFDTGKFRVDKIKKYILMGSSVSIELGYDSIKVNLFTGFIARVCFQYENEEIPCIEITCLDIKGIMMSSNFSRQLKAKTYSEAVKEIFEKVVYKKMAMAGIVDSQLNIDETPDSVNVSTSSDGNEETDETIEMVAESDYEFIVKAASKFNYEFFIDNLCIHFRKAKSNTTVLMKIEVGKGILCFEIVYDFTGIVEEVEVRATDIGKGKLISAKSKYKGKVSIGNKAKSYIKKAKYVYLDATVRSKKQAEYKADSIMEKISYRLGSIEAECIGMPELKPGRFLEVCGLGKPADNIFYITMVRHIFDNENGYRTKIYGKASSVEQSIMG